MVARAETTFEAAQGSRLRDALGALGAGFRELLKDRAGLFGFCVVVLLVFVGIFGGLLAPENPSAQSLLDRLMPPFQSWAHPLGTDNLGRDEFSRLIAGARISLQVGTAVVAIAGTFGTMMGLVAGYFGGKVDSAVMRFVDTQIAFPGLLLALLILAVVSPSLKSVITVLALDGWMVYARLTRGVVLSARETPYVEAARLIGCKPRRVIFRHIVPNLASPLLTIGVLEFARIILAEASLSFLGLGIQPPSVSWGLMVADGHNYLFDAWWLITLPGICIAVVVLGVNLFASWLRVAADPRQRERRFALASVDYRSAGAG